MTEHMGQVSVKNVKRPPDFTLSNRHSPNQDLIALDLPNAAVPLQSFPKTIFEDVSYLFSVLQHIGIVPKDN